MISIKIAVLLVACLALSLQVDAFRYNYCRLNDVGAMPKSAGLSVCSDATGDHCVIKSGSNITYTMAFETVRPFDKATFRVSQVSLKNEYEVYDSIDACGSPGGLRCPSNDKDKQTFSTNMVFNKDFPKGFHNCRFELVDENDQSIMCKQFLALVEE